MNIIIIPAFFQTKDRPTVGSFFMDQAVALRRAGHDVSILYCDTYSVKCAGEYLHYEEENTVTADGIKIYRRKSFCPLKHGIEGYREAFSRGIAMLYEAYIHPFITPDIIHAHCCVWAGYAAMELSARYKVPYVITEHATLFQLHRDTINDRNDKVIAETFRNASKVICVSHAFAQLLSKYRSEREIKVIGNVVDCDLFWMDTKRREDNYKFLTVCYMEEKGHLYKKGIDILFQAWKSVVQKYPYARLVVGGGGNAKQKAQEWCRDLGIEDSVVFKGALSRKEVAEEMRGCRCFVLPSRYETFGVVYIEAMACGKPVIAGKCGGPDDFVNESNGILVQPENAAELADAMEQVITSDRFSGEAIREYAVSRFSYAAIARQLEELYQTCRDNR